MHRGWTTARKHMPIQDVTVVGGWSDPETPATIYQQPDAANEPSESERKAERLAELKAERAAKRLAQGKAVAERRRVGIRRAAGSLAVELDRDVERYVAAVEALVAAVKTCNERFEKVEGLRAEDAALADRFGLDAPASVPALAAPGVRAEAVAVYTKLWERQLADRADRPTRPEVEKDQTGLRTRRTYAEIAGTPGYEIIVQAGLVEFAPLTAEQLEMVAAHESDAALRAAKAKEDSDVLANEAARIGSRVGAYPRARAWSIWPGRGHEP